MARGRHPTRILIGPPDNQAAEKYYLNWDGREVFQKRCQFPDLTSPGIFGNNHPIEIDFGCGTGTFTCNRAKENPEANILGIDKSFKSIYYAVHQAAAQQLDNIKFLRGDFGVMLPQLQPDTLRTAYYLFPTPPNNYRNERANNRRRQFIRTIYTALVPGGKCYFTSDSQPFFDNMHNIITDAPDISLSDPGEDNDEFITAYQKIWKNDGRPVWSFSVEKR